MRFAYLLICQISCFFLQAQSPAVENILSTFNQDGANNCVSIAFIKAAMSKYGYNKVINYRYVGDTYKVQYRNGEKLDITESERALAKEYAKLWVSDSVDYLHKDSVLFYTYLYYACIAKYIEKNGYWGCEENQGKPMFKPMRNFETSLKLISRTGYCTDNGYKLLGLKIKEGGVRTLTGIVDLPKSGVILYSWRHAVAVYNGKLDCYGIWINASMERVCDIKFQWYVELE